MRQRKDGTRVDISLMVSPVKDADGRIVGASKIARDISARKRDEAERAELHRRLTMLVDASASLARFARDRVGPVGDGVAGAAAAGRRRLRRLGHEPERGPAGAW